MEKTRAELVSYTDIERPRTGPGQASGLKLVACLSALVAGAGIVVLVAGSGGIYITVAVGVVVLSALGYGARSVAWPWWVEYQRLRIETETASTANVAVLRTLDLEEQRIQVEAYRAATERQKVLDEGSTLTAGYNETTRTSRIVWAEGKPYVMVAPLGYAPAQPVPHSIRIDQAASPAQLAPVMPQQAPTLNFQGPKFSPALFEEVPFNELKTLLGIRADNGDLDIVSIPKGSHKLIVARSGMGKSTFSLADLLCSMYRNDATHLRVVILDFEGITEPFAPYCLRYARSKQEIIEALKWLNAQVSLTVQKIVRKEITLSALPHYTLVYLEESNFLLNSMNPEERKIYLELLCSFAITARKAGYFLHMASQRPAATNQQLAAIRDTFNLRIAGATKKSFLVDSLEFDDDDVLEEVCATKKPGQFVREIGGKNVIIKTPYLDLDKLDEIIPGMLRHREPTGESPTTPNIITEQPSPVGPVGNAPARAAQPDESRLNDEEKTVLRLVKQGYSTRDIEQETKKKISRSAAARIGYGLKLAGFLTGESGATDEED